MKRAKKLVPRLMAVGVILGMGAISIVQGINESPTSDGNIDPSELALSGEATTAESDSPRGHRLTPFASIGLDDDVSSDNPDSDDKDSFGNSESLDDASPASRFTQVVDVVTETAADVTSQFDRASEQPIPQISRDGNPAQAPLPPRNERSRFSSAPLPVDVPFQGELDDQTALANDTTSSIEAIIPTLTTELADEAISDEQSEFATAADERVNSLRSNPVPDLDATPVREPAQATLPLSSLPSSAEENNTSGNESYAQLPTEDPQDYEDYEIAGGREEIPLISDNADLQDSPTDDLRLPLAAAPSVKPATAQNGDPLVYDAGNTPVDPDPAQDYDPSVAQADQGRATPILAADQPTRALNSVQPNALQESAPEQPGKPGPRVLEGLQAPTLTVEKRAPPEIQIGKMAEFQMTVRNVGKIPATRVVVQDEVPEGTRFVGAEPEISATQGSTLYWELDTLAPGDELTVAMQVMPEVEGEIGSVGMVTFHAEASVRTVATRPMLVLEQSLPERVHVGDAVQVRIRISNPGNGAATSVVLEEDVPDGLSHPAGASLERELGTIRPNESREVELTLSAEKAGIIEHMIVARGDANLVVEDRASIEVIAPELQVAVTGPAKRYLERQAAYALSVENRGTAPARNVELVAHLPKGMKFVEANNAGQYDPRSHAVYWSLEELPAEQAGEVQLVILPIEPGEQKLRFEGQADFGLKDSQEKTILVDGLASLFFEVADTADPIEIGKPTTYEIRLANEGSKDATQIALTAELPPGLMPLDVNGPERSQVNGQQVTFQPLDRLAPGADVYYKIRVQGVAAGNQLIRVQVQSHEMQVAVTEEENTLVYADQ